MTTFVVRGKAISGRLSVSSHGSASLEFQTTAPTPEPTPQISPFLRVSDSSDNSADGPVWDFSSYSLKSLWERPGGDWTDRDDVRWGGNQYGNITMSPYSWDASGGVGVQFTSDNIADLVIKHQSAGNKGYYVTLASGPLPYIGGRRGLWGPPPKLVVTTGAGVFTCALLCAISIAQNSGIQDTFTTNDVSRLPLLLRFDETQIVGTPTDARISVTGVSEQSQSAHLVIFNLDPPFIYDDPAAQLPGEVEPALGDTVLEADLPTHPDVWHYFPLTSLNDVLNHYVSPGAVPLGLNPEFKHWDDINVDYLRGYYDGSCFTAGGNCQRLWRWHMPYQDLGAIPQTDANASWRRPFDITQALGHNEMYGRYILVIDPNFPIYMNEQGIKLSGFECVSDDHPEFGMGGDDGDWQAWTWHGPQSHEHPDIFHGAFYLHHVDRPTSSGVSEVRYWNRKPLFALRTGKRYVIDEYVKMNTFTGATPNHDGILRVWVDNVKVHENIDIAWRKYPYRQIQGWKTQSFHGGGGNPKADIYNEIGGIVSSKVRIGVPKSTLPDWVPLVGTFKEFSLNRPMDEFPQWIRSSLEIWAGGCYVRDMSPYGGIAWQGGGEHTETFDEPGGMNALNIYSRQFEWVSRSPVSPHHHDLYNPAPVIDPYGEWADDHSAQVTHTYNGVQEWPSAFGGGPRGSAVIFGMNGVNSAQAGGLGCGIRHDMNVVGGPGFVYPNYGQFRFTGNNVFDFGGGPAVMNDGRSVSNFDENRGGWWCTVHSKAGIVQQPLSFVRASDGNIRNWGFDGPIFANLNYVRLWHFKNEDILFMRMGTGWSGNDGDFLTTHLFWCYLPDTPEYAASPGWHAVVESGVQTSVDAWGSTRPLTLYGYDAAPWVSHPNYNCFAHIENFYRLNPAVQGQIQVPFWLLKPTNYGSANWWMNPWTWSTEICTSADGSMVFPKSCGANCDSGFVNGIFGRLVYSPPIKSFAWVGNLNTKAQLFRLNNMT
jgi:hypothetical protein